MPTQVPTTILLFAKGMRKKIGHIRVKNRGEGQLRMEMFELIPDSFRGQASWERE